MPGKMLATFDNKGGCEVTFEGTVLPVDLQIIRMKMLRAYGTYQLHLNRTAKPTDVDVVKIRAERAAANTKELQEVRQRIADTTKSLEVAKAKLASVSEDEAVKAQQECEELSRTLLYANHKVEQLESLIKQDQPPANKPTSMENSHAAGTKRDSETSSTASTVAGSEQSVDAARSYITEET